MRDPIARIPAERIETDGPSFVAAIVTMLREVLTETAPAEGEIRLSWSFGDDNVFRAELTSTTSDSFELRGSNTRAEIEDEEDEEEAPVAR